MFIGGILLLTSLWQCSAKSVSPRHPDITQQCTTSSGQIYNVGSIFTDNNCTTRCECLDDGVLSCQPLCSVMKTNSFCANLKIAHIPVALPDAEGKSCSCPSSTCEPEFCYDGGRKYKPGEDFISADCSGSCGCGPRGSIFCVSLCPPVHTRCEIDEEKVQSSRKIDNSNCTCPTWQCVKKKQKVSRPIAIELRNVVEKCVSSNGKIYAVDQVFTDNNCTSRCQCQEGGVLKCRPLCLALPKVGLCAKQNIIHVPIKLPDAEEKSCSCPLVMCETYEHVKEQLYSVKDKAFCFDDGNYYSPGDRFVSRDCSGSCKCGPEGTVTCVSLCPPEDISIKCGINEEKIELPQDIANTNCTCPIWQCVKRKTEDVCIVGDKVYNPGDRFISTDCTSHCECFPGKNIGCMALCSRGMIICKHDEIMKEWSELIPDSKCSCPRWSCVKRPNEFCEIDGEKYKVGERFVTKDCTGYCRCASSTSFGCESLCPPHGIHCTSGTRKVQTVRPAFPGSNCTCPSWKCVRVESKWHPWSNWTECDAKCGGGLRHRFRKCMRNELCFGPDTETEVCNVAPCSQSYLDAPCGAMRINSVEGDIWPRCDDQGYFEPLQCDPSASQCWCVDKWGNIEPGSRRISQKPQCGNNYGLKVPST